MAIVAFEIDFMAICSSPSLRSLAEGVCALKRLRPDERRERRCKIDR
jgi:hypothetical protein